MEQLLGPLFIALPLVLIFVVFSRQRRQQRELVAAQTGIAEGTRVMTTSGVYATVISSTDTTVVLEIAPGTHTTWARQAIARIVEPEPSDAAEREPIESEPAEPGAPPAEPN